MGSVWGHALRIVRNNTVIADAKSQSLGFSLLKVVSLAPPFTFYNHGILDFKPEGSFKRSSGAVPWHNDGCFEDETVLGGSSAECVLSWYSKPFSSRVRCELQGRTGAPASRGIERDETVVLLLGSKAGSLSSRPQRQPCRLRGSVRIPFHCLSPSP